MGTRAYCTVCAAPADAHYAGSVVPGFAFYRHPLCDTCWAERHARYLAWRASHPPGSYMTKAAKKRLRKIKT